MKNEINEIVSKYNRLFTNVRFFADPYNTRKINNEEIYRAIIHIVNDFNQRIIVEGQSINENIDFEQIENSELLMDLICVGSALWLNCIKNKEWIETFKIYDENVRFVKKNFSQLDNYEKNIQKLYKILDI